MERNAGEKYWRKSGWHRGDKVGSMNPAVGRRQTINWPLGWFTRTLGIGQDMARVQPSHIFSALLHLHLSPLIKFLSKQIVCYPLGSGMPKVLPKLMMISEQFVTWKELFDPTTWYTTEPQHMETSKFHKQRIILKWFVWFVFVSFGVLVYIQMFV